MSDTTTGPVDTTPPAEQPVLETTAPAVETPPAPKPDETPKWLKDRIERELQKTRKVAAERDELRAQVEAFRRQQGVGSAGTQQDNQPGGRPETAQEVEARVKAEMAAAQDAASFNSKCDVLAGKITASGRDLNVVLKNFNDVGLDFTKADHRDFVSDIADLPNAEAVFYTLGTNRDEAARLMELPARAQARELKALSDKLSGDAAEAATLASGVLQTAPSPTRQVSAAPRPPGQAPRGASSSTRSLADMSTEEFMAARNKQDRERRGR